MRLCVGARMSQLDIYKGERAPDWATPRSFMDFLNKQRYWKPNLDAAATVGNTKAPRFYNPHQNGLKHPWFGDVWLNPPYGREIPKWLQKCKEEIQRKEVHSIMVLLPARTDTKWFHDMIMKDAYLVYLIRGRFNHQKKNQVKNSNAPFASMLVCYRKHRLGEAGITTLDVPKEARGFGA